MFTVNRIKSNIITLSLCTAIVVTGTFSLASAQLFKKKKNVVPVPAPVSTSTTMPTPVVQQKPVPANSQVAVVLATYKGGKFTGADLQAILKSMSPYERMDMEEQGKDWKKDLVKNAVRDHELYLEAVKLKMDKDPAFQAQVDDKEDRLLVEKLYQKEVLDKVKVTDAEIQNYYDTHTTEFVNPQGEQFKIRYIFVDASKNRKTPEEKEEGYKKIEEAYQQLKEGKNFVEVAKKYSESEEQLRGQVAGPFAKDTILKEIETAALSMKPGEFSSIITTKHGYNIVKLEELTPAVTPFDKVKPSIQGRLIYQKRQQLAMETQKQIFDGVTTYKNYKPLEDTTVPWNEKEPYSTSTTEKKKKYLADYLSDVVKSSGLLSESTTESGSKTLMSFIKKFDKSGPVLLEVRHKSAKTHRTLADVFKGIGPAEKYTFTLTDLKLRKKTPQFAPQWQDLASQKRSLDQLAQIKAFVLEAKAQGLDKDPSIVRQLQQFKEKELASRLLNQKIDTQLAITDAELHAYYAKNSVYYFTQREIFARMILIKAPRENITAMNAAKDTCWQIYSEITAGADFIDLAKKYSQGPNPDKGGELGWVRMGPSGYLFDTAAFALKQGEMSIPVPQRQGYAIIKVDDIRDPKLKPFDEVKDQVKQAVTYEKRGELSKKITDEILAKMKFKLDEKQLVTIN